VTALSSLAPPAIFRSGTGPALAAAVIATIVVSLLVRLFDAPVVLVALVGVSAAVGVVMRTELATLLAVVLLYINVPAIMTQRHGIPEGVAGAFILLLGVPLAQRLIVRRQAVLFDVTFLLMLALLGTLLLSSVQAVDMGIAFARVRGYVFEGLLLYWLLVNVVRDLHTLRRVIVALLAVGALVSALCLYQDLTGSYRQDFWGLAPRDYVPAEDTGPTAAPVRRSWDRAQGPVNEPNRFAQTMIVLLPLAIFMYRRTRSRWSRNLAAAAGVLILIGVLLTMSRGALLTLLLMGGAMIALRWLRPSRFVAGTVALALLVPLVAPFFLTRVQSITNVTYLFSDDPAAIRQADGAIRGRTTEMLAALLVFADHALTGVGPGQFSPFYFEKYGQTADIKFRDIRKPRRAHTMYFELAAELGVLGLIVFVAIAGLLVRRLWLVRRYWLPRRPEYADLAAACALSVGAYLSTAMFLHLSYQRYYWFLIAVASATAHLLRERAEVEGR
jgi:putative inorganic carbon (HCO3(-)) transporter